jgi:hypothetical protein
LDRGFESRFLQRRVYCKPDFLVWVKDNAGMGSLYRSQHELVFVFKQGRQGHRNNVQLGQFGRNRSNVWHYPGANSFARCGEEGNLLALHPTVKPVAMVADAILDCSARGDIVLEGHLLGPLVTARQAGGLFDLVRRKLRLTNVRRQGL